MFRIGDFSRLARVSARQLRFYEEMGLFAPAHADPQTGFAGRPVSLASGGAGADEHDIGELAQAQEHVAVGRVAERAGAAIHDDRPVEAGDHAQRHPWPSPCGTGLCGAGGGVGLGRGRVAGRLG